MCICMYHCLSAFIYWAFRLCFAPILSKPVFSVPSSPSIRAMPGLRVEICVCRFVTAFPPRFVGRFANISRRSCRSRYFRSHFRPPFPRSPAGGSKCLFCAPMRFRLDLLGVSCMFRAGPVEIVLFSPVYALRILNAPLTGRNVYLDVSLRFVSISWAFRVCFASIRSKSLFSVPSSSSVP